MMMLFTLNFKQLFLSICIISALTLAVACSSDKGNSLKVSNEAYLIYNANIVSVEDGNLLDSKAILIDSGIIKSIGNYDFLLPLVQQSNTINANEKYIIPGLWDMHVHIEGEELVPDNKALFPVYIAYGITTVRDMASDLGEQVLQWRDDIEQDKFLGPQIFTAGRKLEGINSIWKGDLEIANEAELAQMLDKLEGYEVDLVKITENALDGPLFLKSTEEASKRGFLVSGHVPISLTFSELVAAGFSSIEHASYLLRLGSNEQEIVDKVKNGSISGAEANEYYTANFDQETANKAYKSLSNTGVYVTPTLIGGKQLAYLNETDHSNDAYLDFLTDRFTSKYQWRIDRMANDTPEQTQARKDRYELIAKQLPFLQKAGIPILAGSDAAALNTYVYPALALHEEMLLFQEAGLTPIEILRSATINGAKFMGKEASMASITEGKEADLVFLNSNPLENIKATQDIDAVINNGDYFDRQELDALLNEAKAEKTRLDTARDSMP